MHVRRILDVLSEESVAILECHLDLLCKTGFIENNFNLCLSFVVISNYGVDDAE